MHLFEPMHPPFSSGIKTFGFSHFFHKLVLVLHEEQWLIYDLHIRFDNIILIKIYTVKNIIFAGYEVYSATPDIFFN